MKKHFTLVEVLIVVAVIGILASIIFASLRRAREIAYRVDCGSQLKQISTTFFLHSSLEKRGFLPAYNWMQKEGMRDTYKCVKDDTPLIMNYFTTSNQEVSDVDTSYGFNLSVNAGRITDIKNPHDFILSFDAGDLTNADGSDGSGDGGNPNGNKGLGNNDDGNDSDNPHHGDGSVDTDENGGGGGNKNGGYWVGNTGDVDPDDVNNWYYNNVNYRHLNTANHLFADGSVRVIRNKVPLSWLMGK